jgi:hypothetical protein
MPGFLGDIGEEWIAAQKVMGEEHARMGMVDVTNVHLRSRLQAGSDIERGAV